MHTHEFVQALEDLFGRRVKIKLCHTTRGYTWEVTVKGDTEDEALASTEDANNRILEYIKTKEV